MAKAKYPTTKAGLLRLVKDLEKESATKDDRIALLKERIQDLRGDVNSCGKHQSVLKRTLEQLRIGYAELRGYAVSIIDADSPPVVELGGPQVFEYQTQQQPTLPANFPSTPEALYNLVRDGERLPF